MNFADLTEFLLINLLPFWSALFTLIAALSWPLAIWLIARTFKAELRSLFERMTKFSVSGAEINFVDQKLGLQAVPTSLDELENFEGIERTKAIADLELQLHRSVEKFPFESRLNLTIRELAQSRLDLHFTNVYHAIFGSQIRLLKKLRETGGLMDTEKFESYFNVLQMDGEIHAERTSEDYLRFLFNYHLVTEEDGKLALTPLGQDFLLFLFRFSLTEDRPF